MSDLHERLRSTLAELHQELDEADFLDPETEAALRKSAADIQHKLDNPEEPLDAPREEGDIEIMLHKFGEKAQEFEASHPTFSGILGSIVEGLRQLGI